jgi:hypothetical protein
LRTENTRCSSRRECAEGELCVLTGYSDDPRANRDMQSRCLPARGGSVPEASAEPMANAPRITAPVETAKLLDEVKKLRAKSALQGVLPQ